MKKLFTIIGLLTVFALTGANAQILINVGTYSQNFDSMGTTSTPSYPTSWAGWKVSGTGSSLAAGTIMTTSTNPAFTTNDGSSGTGRVYNYGLNDNTNRSLGSVSSGSTVVAFGASFKNNTSLTLTGSNVSMGFTARQWRTGSSTSVDEVWAFEYKFGGNLTDSTEWLQLTTFDINEILTTTTTSSAVDGTASGNFSVLSPTSFTGLSGWGSGQTLHIRWVDTNNSGTDAGMAIDDFTMTVIPEPGTWALLGMGVAFVLWRQRRRSTLA